MAKRKPARKTSLYKAQKGGQKRRGVVRVPPPQESNGFGHLENAKSLISHDTEMPQNAGVGSTLEAAETLEFTVDRWGFIHRIPGTGRKPAPTPEEAPSEPSRLSRKNGMWRLRDRWGEMHYYSKKPDLAQLEALEAKEQISGAKTALKDRLAYRVDPKILKAPRRGFKGELGLYAWPA